MSSVPFWALLVSYRQMKRDVYIKYYTERRNPLLHLRTQSTLSRARMKREDTELWFFRACIRFSVVREFFFTQSSFNLRKMGKCHYQRAMYLSHLHIKLNSIKRKTDNPTIVISIYWFDCGCNRQYRQKPAINNATKKKEDKHNCLLAKQHYPFRISCQRT